MRRIYCILLAVMFVVTPIRLSFTVLARTKDFLSKDILHKLEVSQSNITIYSYTGKAEILGATTSSGSMNFDLTCEFELEDEKLAMDWYIATDILPTKQVKVDGSDCKFTFNKGTTTIKPNKPLLPGRHKMQMIYGGNLIYSDPSNIRVQIFVNNYHFHCYNAWFPMVNGALTAPLVKFSIDVKISSDFFLLGSFVPKEYRDKPKSDGKYHIEVEKAEVFSMKLAGGDYDIYKEGNEKFSIRIYTFKNQKASVKTVAKHAKNSAVFYSEYFNKPCADDFFIASQTGRKGNGQGFDGGYVIDSPYMADQNFAPDFLAHECAHLSWWGGTGVLGDIQQPNNRFFSEAFAEYSTILYCYTISEEEGKKCWKKNYDTYYKNRNENDPMLSDSSCTWYDYLIYNKGSIVLWALKNKLGDEKMRDGLRVFVEKYTFKNNKDFNRPKLSDFKQVMEESSGVNLDDFWKLHFNTNKIVALDCQIRRNVYKDNIVDQVVLKNLSYTDYPMILRIFHFDGTSSDLEFKEKEKNVTLDRLACGYEFINFNEVISRPNDTNNYLNAMTIAASITWGKPPLIIADLLDPESIQRAKLWKEKTGGEIAGEKFFKDPKQAIILVGFKIIINHNAGLLEKFPVSIKNDHLLWNGDKIFGNFQGVFSLGGYGSSPPIIADLGNGTLPVDLSYSGIYKTEDNMLELKFNSEKFSEIVPPSAGGVLSFPWSQKDNVLSESRFSLDLNPKTEYKASYYGFDENKFKFGLVEKQILPGQKQFNPVMAFDKNGTTNMAIRNSSQLFGEIWNFQFKSKDSSFYEGPFGFSIPKFISNDTLKLDWKESLTYFYSIDGTLSGKWENSNTLNFSNLSPKEHELKIVFIGSGGYISKIFSGKFMVKSDPPKLIIDKKRALRKKNTITISGITCPECSVEPEAMMGKDGSFRIEIQIDDTKTVTEFEVKAKDKYGSETVVKVPVVKYIKFSMQIGDKIAQDEDGNSVLMTVSPRVLGKLTYVPMRFVGTQLGAKIDYDSASKKIIYQLDGTVVELWIGKQTAIVNGKEFSLPGLPVVLDGYTLVPLRFISEALGANVVWKGETKTIIVEYPAN